MVARYGAGPLSPAPHQGVSRPVRQAGTFHALSRPARELPRALGTGATMGMPLPFWPLFLCQVPKVAYRTDFLASDIPPDLGRTSVRLWAWHIGKLDLMWVVIRRDAVIWHNHVGSPRLVLGAPDPNDERDDLMVIEEGANFDRKLSAYNRASWLSVFRALRRIQANNGRLPSDSPD